jgi:hypothetical protein
VRCASGRLLRGLAGSGISAADALQQLDALGSAFARVSPEAPGAEALVEALLALPDDSALLLPPSALAGANVWLLGALNASLAAAGAPVSLWGVHAPDALWQGGQVTQDVLNSYLLDTLGFDCVLDASLESASSAARFALLHAHEAFGYTVVARVPEVAARDAAARLWTWVRPFSAGVWGIIVAMFFTSAALMQWYEGDGEGGEYGKFNARGGAADGAPNAMTLRAQHGRSTSKHMSKFAHGVYLSFSSFATNNSQTFQAKTLPGRIYRITYAFVILLTCSCYVANLAAVLSYVPPAAAAISSMASFEALNVPACVLNNSLHIAFLNAEFPNTKLHVLASEGGGDSGDVNTEQTERDLLAALAAPDAPCLGGVAPDAALAFWLGAAGDPSGEFCALRLVGQPLSQGMVSLTMHRGTTAQQLAALSGVVAAEVASGRYAAAMTQLQNFPTLRSSCSGNDAKSMGLEDFSGIFLVLAFGALASVLSQLALLAAPHALGPSSMLFGLTQRALARPSSGGGGTAAKEGMMMVIPATVLGGSSPTSAGSAADVAEAMAAHALTLAALRNAAGALAESGAALEGVLAAAARVAVDGAALSPAAGAAVVAANAA